LIDAEFALNEAANLLDKDGKYQRMTSGRESVPEPIKLRVTNPGRLPAVR
jgi:hypothetical protein